MKRLFDVAYHDDDGVVEGIYDDATCPDLDYTFPADGSTRVDAGEEQWDREELQCDQDDYDDFAWKSFEESIGQ